MTRKEFLGTSAAFAATRPMCVFAAAKGARPLMRLGLLADVHLETGETGKGLQNCLCYEPALRYFDKRKADGVIVAGDITDFGTGAALRQIAGRDTRLSRQPVRRGRQYDLGELHRRIRLYQRRIP